MTCEGTFYLIFTKCVTEPLKQWGGCSFSISRLAFGKIPPLLTVEIGGPKTMFLSNSEVFEKRNQFNHCF